VTGERKPLDYAPLLPYQGTEGFVERPASEARARENARNGVSRQRQKQVLEALDHMPTGAIWTVLGHALQLHHGQVSSTLSVLHQAGEVFQLRRIVERCHPYVHSKYRHMYREDERYDFPTRTNATILKQRSGVAMANLNLAIGLLDACRDGDTFVVGDRQCLYVRQFIADALDALNGKRDGD